MSLEEIIKEQPVVSFKYEQVPQAIEFCKTYIRPNDCTLTLDAAVAYGIMLGKRIARSKREAF